MTSESQWRASPGIENSCTARDSANVDTIITQQVTLTWALGSKVGKKEHAIANEGSRGDGVIRNRIAGREKIEKRA